MCDICILIKIIGQQTRAKKQCQESSSYEVKQNVSYILKRASRCCVIFVHLDEWSNIMRNKILCYAQKEVSIK